MNISVIGAGYVGLVSGTCLADLGNTVYCIDTDESKLNALNNGNVPFFEPGLSEKIQRNYKANRLQFSNQLEDSLAKSKAIFICVGTPPLENGAADVTDVLNVAQTIIDSVRNLNDSETRYLVIKSTVPVGTCRSIVQHISLELPYPEHLLVCSNPEFLREGSAIHDFFKPDRIVIGSDSKSAIDAIASLYESLYRNRSPVVKTSLETSELSKYASNAFLATKISFINEIATICDKTGANVKDVAKIMGLDGRIGPYFLHPGPGFGGSCFPKDNRAFISFSKDLDYDLKIVQASENVNELQKRHAFNILLSKLNGAITNKTIAILGLSFKPNTDDIRDSASLILIDQLLESGAFIRCFDPEGIPNTKKQFPTLYYAKDSYDACDNADAIILMTEWNSFRKLDLSKIKQHMCGNVFLDMRNVYDSNRLRQCDFDSYSVGSNHQ